MLLSINGYIRIIEEGIYDIAGIIMIISGIFEFSSAIDIDNSHKKECKKGICIFAKTALIIKSIIVCIAIFLFFNEQNNKVIQINHQFYDGPVFSTLFGSFIILVVVFFIVSIQFEIWKNINVEYNFTLKIYIKSFLTILIGIFEFFIIKFGVPFILSFY